MLNHSKIRKPWHEKGELRQVKTAKKKGKERKHSGRQLTRRNEPPDYSRHQTFRFNPIAANRQQTKRKA